MQVVRDGQTERSEGVKRIRRRRQRGHKGALLSRLSLWATEEHSNQDFLKNHVKCTSECFTRGEGDELLIYRSQGPVVEGCSLPYMPKATEAEQHTIALEKVPRQKSRQVQLMC